MRIAICLLIVVSAAATSLSATAASADDKRNAVADYLGQVNAWRLIPSTLLTRCIKEAPQQDSERRAIFEAWRRANEKLINSIERIVDLAASQFASETSLSRLEAKERINAATTELINEHYFQDRSISAAQVCAGYSDIVAGLSASGKVATTRGHVYTVEGLLAVEQPSSSNQAQPYAPEGRSAGKPASRP